MRSIPAMSRSLRVAIPSHPHAGAAAVLGELTKSTDNGRSAREHSLVVSGDHVWGCQTAAPFPNERMMAARLVS